MFKIWDFQTSVLSIFAYSQIQKLGFQKSDIYKHSSFRYLPVAKYEHQSEVQNTSSRIKLSGKNKKNGFLDIEIQALTKDGYFWKDLDKFLYFNINEYQKSWMFRWTFRNYGFLWSNFSYLNISEYWLKRRMFENSRIFEI